MILKTNAESYGGNPISSNLTLTFGPGVVRYINPCDLIPDSGRHAIEEIKSYGQRPTIKFPTTTFVGSDLGFPRNSEYWNSRFKFYEFPSLFDERPYEDLIHDVAAIFSYFSKEPFTSEAYWLFHHYTESKRLVIDEFAESWMREASGNHDLTQSYSVSDDHFLLTVGYGSTYVYKKTEYVVQSRKAIDEATERLVRESEKRQSDESKQRFDDAIRRSSFEVFTYLIEDTRNGMMKIGKSKNPERREKTLQSEAPSVELRIAVPTENDFESELHGEFEHLRQRGEWFDLSSSDIKILIERLFTHGDPSRAITCHEWLGSIFLSAYAGDGTRDRQKETQA